jgi:hypothetical protein
LYVLDFPASDHSPGGNIAHDPGNVGTSKYGNHACHCPRRSHVDRADARMRVWTTQYGSVEHIRQLHIVDKCALASHQLWVFTPFYRLACIAHPPPPFIFMVRRA